MIFFRDRDGRAPALDWLAALTSKARDKCRVRLERLRELGHELRRPEADFLRSGIYELRASISGVHYRILYFFYGNTAVVISHGLVKEKEVPSREIEIAVWRKAEFERNPKERSYEENVG